MPAQILRELGQRLARLRHERGLTQEELAERAGIATSYLSRIEIGMRQPTIVSLARIAAALRVPLWRCVADPADRSVRDPSSKLSRVAVGLTEKEVELLVAIARELKRRR